MLSINQLSSWVRSWTMRGVILTLFVATVVIATLFGDKSNARNLISPNGYDVYEVQTAEQTPVNTMIPFYLHIPGWAYLICQPLSPDGVYACAFSDKPPNQ